jgi:hypothetical protein
MRVTGSIICRDQVDQNVLLAQLGQSATISCLDTTDIFGAYGFSITKTLWTSIDTTFVQGMELNVPSPLSLTLLDRRFQGWTSVDGTYVDGTYTEPRYYDPLWISYGLYKNSSDGSSWALQGYRYREPIHTDVGQFSATMALPNDPGLYRFEWLYKKDQSSDVTAINQIFNVTYWGNNPYYGYYIIPTNDQTAPTDYTPFPKYSADFGEWIGNNWGLRWPQYLW